MAVHNNKKHGKHFPYALILDGKWVGCYAESHKAKMIACAALLAGDAKVYKILGLNDNVVDSSD